MPNDLPQRKAAHMATVEERLLRIEKALWEVYGEAKLAALRLDKGGFDAFSDGTAIGRYLRGIQSALQPVVQDLIDAQQADRDQNI